MAGVLIMAAGGGQGAGTVVQMPARASVLADSLVRYMGKRLLNVPSSTAAPLPYLPLPKGQLIAALHSSASLPPPFAPYPCPCPPPDPPPHTLPPLPPCTARPGSRPPPPGPCCTAPSPAACA